MSHKNVPPRPSDLAPRPLEGLKQDEFGNLYMINPQTSGQVVIVGDMAIEVEGESDHPPVCGEVRSIEVPDSAITH